jgi:hypothetical protein
MQMKRGKSNGGGLDGMMPQLNPEGAIPEMSPNGAVGFGEMPKLAKRMLAPGNASDGVQRDHKGDPKRLNLLVDNGGHRIPEIVKLIDGTGAVLESVELHKPTLDDVFLSVTGRNIRDERGSHMEEVRRRRTVRQARGQRVRG